MLAGAWGVKNSTWKENGWRDEMERDLRIAVFGQKRLSREGGVEIVVKELCTRMAQQGCQVTCYNRSGHHVSGAEYDDIDNTNYEGIRQKSVPTIEKKGARDIIEQIKLYESYADGVLLRDAYIEKKKALSEKLAALQDSIRTEKEEQECADELDEEIRALTKQASEKTYIGGLTKECVDAFVSMVYLYDDQTMKIEFNCEDVIRRALEKYGA